MNSTGKLNVPEKMKKFRNKVEKLLNVMRAVKMMQKGKLRSKGMLKAAKEQKEET